MTVIVAAVVALINVDALRNGRSSPLTTAVSAVFSLAQSGVSAVANGTRDAVAAVASAPRLSAENAQLRTENAQLRDEAARLREAVAQAPAAAALASAQAAYPQTIAARVIGYDPEAQQRLISIDKGSASGIARDAGVLSADGIVGRVIASDPLSSKVLLATDTASKIPALVQRGRWWGLATGTGTRISLRFVSQDASLRVGDVVVTGEGRAFPSGIPLGRIVAISHPDGALYQTALLEPAASFGTLERVLVFAHQ